MCGELGREGGREIIDKTPNRRTWQIKEAIWIRKTKNKGNYEICVQ